MTGIIKFYNNQRGFGFIAADNGEDYFYHISNVENMVAPVENQCCIFDTNPTEKGVQAVNVKLIAD